MEKVEAWRSSDGLLFDSEKEAAEHEKAIRIHHSTVELMQELLNPEEFNRGQVNLLIEIFSDGFERIRRFVTENCEHQESNIALLASHGIWLSSNGELSRIANMSGNHLHNAYKIATEEKRPYYGLYKNVLLDELKKRGLRKEVVADGQA